MNARKNQERPPRDPIALVAFLGNPGQEHRRTRHNVAWQFCESLQLAPPESWKEKFHSRFVRLDGLCYLLPETFMNESGRAVQAAAAFFSLPPAQILVVCDDTETDFGVLTVTFGGGHRGQNGIRSIERALGSAGFWRLRIGVGRPAVGSLSSHVLSGFDHLQTAWLPDLFARAGTMLRAAITRPEIDSQRVGERSRP